MCRLLLAVAVAAGIAEDVTAQARAFETGNTLLAKCTASATSEPVPVALCYGYITAIVDIFLGSTQPTILSWRACMPSGASKGQVVDVVVKRLTENPQDRHHTAPSLVAEALAKAFPCR